MRGTAASTVGICLLLLALLHGQGSPPASPLTLISREGRRPVPTTVVNGQELIALDDVATLFGVTVREDALAGGVTVTARNQTIVMSADQPMASVSGRVIALPSPVVRSGRRWLVPLDFLPRALGPIYDQRIELRRASRLLIVGPMRVPRVTARIDNVGPPTRAVLEIAPAAPVSIGTDLGRVLVRIDADALDLALPAAGGGLIDQIRAGDQVTTVAIAVNARAGTPRVVPTTADDVTRVVVEVPAANAPAETAAPPAAPPAATPPAGEPPPVFTGVPRTGVQTVVIDPGHGGTDVGARGAGGAEEKAVTLAVARTLRGMIETRLGLRVILTRDDDRAVSQDERAALANNSKADLFLSLHANRAPTPAVSGAEVFHLRLDEAGEEARRAAQAEAMTLPVIGGGTRALEIVRWDLAQARHVERSGILAGLIEEELRGRVSMGPRPRQQAPLRVLVGANMPAALVEIGYLSNAEQEKVIVTDAYQGLVAQALYEAVVRFRAQLEARPE